MEWCIGFMLYTSSFNGFQSKNVTFLSSWLTSSCIHKMWVPHFPTKYWFYIYFENQIYTFSFTIVYLNGTVCSLLTIDWLCERDWNVFNYLLSLIWKINWWLPIWFKSSLLCRCCIILSNKNYLSFAGYQHFL